MGRAQKELMQASYTSVEYLCRPAKKRTLFSESARAHDAWCWLTFAFEGEILGEVAALVVTSEENDLGRIPDLERVQVEQTL